MADFNTKLSDFQTWVAAELPGLSPAVNQVVSNTYISQLGDAANNPALNTADKLGDLFNAIGNTYVNSVSAYYLAKQKIADLKLAAKGSTATQLINTAQGAIGIPPANMLLWGGLALVGAVLLSRR